VEEGEGAVAAEEGGAGVLASGLVEEADGALEVVEGACRVGEAWEGLTEFQVGVGELLDGGEARGVGGLALLG